MPSADWTPASFVDGLIAALWVGAAAVGLATFAAIAIPPRQDVMPDSVSYLAAGDEFEARFGEPALVPVRSDDERMVG